MRIQMFTKFSTETLAYLRRCGNDTGRIEARITSGENLKFISSHHRANGGWVKGLDASANEWPGEFLDENALWVDVNDFYEWHGGSRYDGHRQDRNTDR